MSTRKTTKFEHKESYQNKWFLIDADGVSLGRLATGVATILMGKHRPSYTPNIDSGDFVIVTNCQKVRLTGRKLDQKEYVWYTGYPGGQRFLGARDAMRTKPKFVIEHAVRLMLPKNKLADKMLKKLKLYAGEEHEHKAQKPVTIDFKGQKSVYLAAKDN